jgi:hypothetical protein
VLLGVGMMEAIWRASEKNSSSLGLIEEATSSVAATLCVKSKAQAPQRPSCTDGADSKER